MGRKKKAPPPPPVPPPPPMSEPFETSGALAKERRARRGRTKLRIRRGSAGGSGGSVSY